MKTKALRFLRILAAALISAVLLVSLVACAGDDTSLPPAAEGYAFSGKIVCDGTGLAGVSVFLNGEEVSATDANGVFSLVGLSYGDTVAFRLEGYSFSPDSYTVRRTVNDLDVRASRTALPDDGDDDEQPAPPDGDEDDGEEPAEPERLPRPTLYVRYEEDGGTLLVLVADGRATSFTLSSDDDTAVTVSFESETFLLGGIALSLSSTRDGDTVTAAVDISPLGTAGGAAYTLTVALSAQGCLPSEEVRTEAVFPPAPAAIGAPSFDADALTVSWQASNLPEGCFFAVYADGVLVGTTSLCAFSLSGVLPAGEHGLVVAALCDGVAVALSPTSYVTVA